MIVVLLLIIVLLLLLIVRLYFDFYQQKKTFETSITALEDVITALQQSQRLQSNRLQLSDGLSQQLKKSNLVLSNSILDINSDLLGQLFPKKKS
ncbi:hypothetical protein [Flavobacterium restrictum]|uniref:Uncharacterized protein n=1 Tax=Flavobacterium restrictum TaxID=2594428 RepID=A0A553E9E5_9FLAO|nr:hypothetical protein [Flavobacterium restrictum]TRX41511.1 hypothetical protein FNW21_05285 [Flavobacterium restrictum]